MLPLVYLTLLVAFGLIFYTSVPYAGPHWQNFLGYYAPPTIGPAKTWLTSLILDEELVVGHLSRVIIRFILEHASTLCMVMFVLVAIFVCILVHLFYAQRQINWMLEDAIYEERRFLEHVMEHINPVTSTPMPIRTSQSTTLPCASLIKCPNIVAEGIGASTDPETPPRATELTLPASPSPPFSSQSEFAPPLTPNIAPTRSPIPSLVLVPSTSETEQLVIPEAEITYCNLSPAVSDYSNLMELALAFPSQMSSFTSEFTDQRTILDQSLTPESNTKSFRDGGADSVMSADSTAVTISLDKSRKPTKFEEFDINATHFGDTTIVLDHGIVPSDKDETNGFPTLDTSFCFEKTFDNVRTSFVGERPSGCNMSSEIYCSSARKTTSISVSGKSYIIPQRRCSEQPQDATRSESNWHTLRPSRSMTRLAPVIIDKSAEERLHDAPPPLTQSFVPSTTSDNVLSSGHKSVCDEVTRPGPESFPDADTTLDVLIAEFANAEEVFMNRLDSAPILPIPEAPTLRKISVFIENELADGSAPQAHKRMPSGPLNVIRNGVPRRRENSKGAAVVTRGRENSRNGGAMGEKPRIYVEAINGLRREGEAMNKRKKLGCTKRV